MEDHANGHGHELRTVILHFFSKTIIKFLSELTTGKKKGVEYKFIGIYLIRKCLTPSTYL